MRARRYIARISGGALKIIGALLGYMFASFGAHHALPAIVFFVLYLAICLLVQVDREIKLYREASSAQETKAQCFSTIKRRVLR